jgi:hypothetical protein
LLGELSDEELLAYRGCWAHGLTGGCNYYRASPLHPDTPDAPGRMAAVSALLDPADFQVKVRTQVIWGTGDVALRPVLAGGAGAARERPARPPHRGRRPLGDTAQRR